MINLDSPRWISDCKRIPSLPHEARHLIVALTNEDIDYLHLAKIIEAHPAIAARLIALANSAWAAPANPVTTIENACIRLGFSIVRSVSIGLAVISPFNVLKCPVFDIQRYWVSCMLVAEGAAQLAAETPLFKQSSLIQRTARTAGILHNVGLLCLAHVMPKETQQALDRVSADPELNVLNALRQTLDTDYCEVGGFVADTWGIPPDLAVPIRHHRDISYQDQFWELSNLVGDAVMMVAATFKNQESVPQCRLRKELLISQDLRTDVFITLREQFDKTSEMAKSLFN
ncbi:MAG: HDOD domain-containing protein [Gammaproteobacteria bacterium]